MRWRRAAVVLGAIGYDVLVRPALLDWGATDAERRMRLPGDEIVQDVMSHHTRAVTIDAPPAAVWPWVVQIGDRRAGFYSYDWVERYLFLASVDTPTPKPAPITNLWVPSPRTMFCVRPDLLRPDLGLDGRHIVGAECVAQWAASLIRQISRTHTAAAAAC